MIKINDIWDEWGSLKTYDDVLRMNIKYLKGIIDYTPYNFGPLDDSHKYLADNLITLHEHRIYTDNGQAPLKEYNIPHDEFKNLLYSMEQKSYLEGMIPKEYTLPLIKYLEQFKDIKYCFLRQGIYNKKNRELEGSLITNMEDDLYWVTRGYVSSDKVNDYKNIKWTTENDIQKKYTSTNFSFKWILNDEYIEQILPSLDAFLVFIDNEDCSETIESYILNFLALTNNMDKQF